MKATGERTLAMLLPWFKPLLYTHCPIYSFEEVTLIWNSPGVVKGLPFIALLFLLHVMVLIANGSDTLLGSGHIHPVKGDTS